MTAICTPSSSIRPLIKLPTFWNAIDGMMISVSVAVSCIAPTYLDPIGINHAELLSLPIVSVPDVSVIVVV